MAKFSTLDAKRPVGPGKTTGPAVTAEGGRGFEKGAKTALYSRAVTDRIEGTFYENVNDGSALASLVAPVVAKDPEWVAEFVAHLRSTMNMRSASIVVAAEYAAAGGPNPRSVVRSAMARADEPAEMLGYWLARKGRRIPAGVKRGIADGARELYNERSALKYDGHSRRVRMADVINLTHPMPVDEDQSALFRWLLDRRHGHAVPWLSRLGVVAADARLLALPEDERRANLGRIGEAGWTWERLAGWLPGGMDAQAWEAVIPQMGYMALLRNLRNFENAGVRSDVLDGAAATLADPREVARSRQFPYRFYSAWKFSDTMRFGPALEAAMDASLSNVPKLAGRTLVLVDTSGSMQGGYGGHSKIAPVEIAAVFAAGLAASSDVDLAIYADHVAPVNLNPRSVLRTATDLNSTVGKVGHGTNTWPAAQATFDPARHDRIVVLTDMQDHPSRGGFDPSVPVYVWDLAGMAAANIDIGAGRYLLSGFTDAHFSLMGRLEAGRSGRWPWET